ncbi:MFS transporter [Candidatus Desantisbacteria bacterium CG1_02_38_46]|uniref:MFS transporter n=3 Tax=unclassified Candidatus Desantisiibacteriota TaxID=3106372 RepID=A0A2H9P9X9_9BACT|nr:MAG: MFS transporter [Candidatus Desantisbacteria bacterium CG1_02_38_46]PIU51819.1 MAG: MFS transporter [Candidatus Desantisbacteria bacterium CG07_land_8_20_14_0_80_39_15]PIZ15151.1 MAG: MFS transporter [Candidatus Desantisbacteria bacterium CG_4_10_14_0_8_um_filter_39_17]
MLKTILRALRYKNYRLFFSGQCISLIGTWMQLVAMSWLVYRLTNSAFLLGVVGFAGQIPAFLLVPFAGVLIDRWNRHRILVITQILSMIQAFVLAFLTMTGIVTFGHIIFLAIFLGLVNAFDMPSRHSFVVDMVEKKEDLGNAIALNSSLVNGARLIGPPIAGVLIAAVGEGMCFLINAISFLAAIISLLSMKITPVEKETRRRNVLQELREGLTYAFSSIPIRYIILFLGLFSLVGMPYTILMPVFAKEILHGGPYTLGLLMGFSGGGALIGAIYLASRKSVRGLVRKIPIAASIFGVGLVVFSLSRILWLSLALMLITGFGMMVQLASSNTVLQTIVDDEKRGRVMSLYVMAFIGMAPFGSLLAGGLASLIGAPNTLLICGGLCILGSILFVRKFPLLRKAIRPIYVKMGIIPGTY